ncbi:neuromedin-S isoform X3 [Anomalospiza imberbis]|uniref:neuromedin-S isoform X3 n=1 Tax=Anomalospiza imberbis TaxID=187417 RepID=UPI00358FB4E2
MCGSARPHKGAGPLARPSHLIPAMPSSPPALPWLLAACCLCALPRGSGFPQPFSRYRDGVELPPNQISSSVLDLCYSIFNSMHKNEESQIASAKFTKKDSHGTLGRPFFLFRVSESLCFKDSESQTLLYVHRQAAVSQILAAVVLNRSQIALYLKA